MPADFGLIVSPVGFSGGRCKARVENISLGMYCHSDNFY
jgi:hypothetical protein